ncbi:MAG: hypothetical protein N3A66_06145 [Planctomycetota bacterium]|nr:hypothetical protein [Planctomycetota bacterium]
MFCDGLDERGRRVARHSVHEQALALMLGIAAQHHGRMIQQRLLPYLRDEKIDGAAPSAFWCTYVLEEMALRGTINWTNFGPHGEDWLGFIFLITRFCGVPPRENEEGTLIWHPVARLAELPMWEGDRHFLPLVFDRDPRIFHGYMPYSGERSKGWTYVRI